MDESFPIISVPPGAAESEEAMGTKFKFWYRDEALGECLFKLCRENTGEDWSEKMAAELAELLGLPHARYELATWDDQRGVVSLQMLPSNTDLLHGNDILAAIASDYPRDQGYNLSQHTWRLVMQVLSEPGVKLPLSWRPPEGISTPVSVFLGYLLLDAWIGNGDRHHENWGFIYDRGSGKVHLAPTYDHASCLGREILDSKRQARFQNKMVENYAKKALSAFYAQEGDRKPLRTFELFCEVANRYPKSATIWLKKLATISEPQIRELFAKVPTTRISPLAIEFACQMLEINQRRLVALQETWD